MTKRMLVNAAQEGEVRVAIVEDNFLEELNVAIEGTELIRGNLYKGTVVSVEPGLQAAFVDYGADRNGFITFNDIDRRYYSKEPRDGERKLMIQDAIRPGTELLVQVYKEEVGRKGAALTTDITLPGRYLVLRPYSGNGGVSRKIEDEATRKKLKELISKLNIPDEYGLIVRTAGQGSTKTELQKDYQGLVRIWGHAQARFQQLSKPGLIYREADVVIRSVRDYFTKDVIEILVDDESVEQRLIEFFEKSSPEIVERVKRYRGKMPLFSNFGLERQLEEIATPKVTMPSGGSIVINQTEALTAIDVNSGKSKGQSSQEEMAYQTNVEAAEMAARQMRLRDIGGLIVIDFIDMQDNKNRRNVERALKKAMKRDKARVEIGRISRFGLLEMSRQRIKARLISSTHTVCPMCEGSGFVMNTEVAALTMLRRLQELAVSAPSAAKIRGRLPVSVALCLLNDHRLAIGHLEEDFNVSIEIIPEIGAVSTRDAFEIVAGHTEKPRDEKRDKRERRDRRDRRDRHRGKRHDKSPRSNQHAVNDGQNPADESLPYEPPKVVGFIEPDQLATADLGPSDDADELLDGAGESAAAEDEGGRKRRRRRRRRKRRPDDETRNEATTPAQEHSEGERAEVEQVDDAQSETTAPAGHPPEDDEQTRKRAAARARNRARRERRLRARNQQATDAPPSSKPDVSPAPSPTLEANTPSEVPISQNEHRGAAARSAVSAARKLRASLTASASASAAAPAKTAQTKTKTTTAKQKTAGTPSSNMTEKLKAGLLASSPPAAIPSQNKQKAKDKPEASKPAPRPKISMAAALKAKLITSTESSDGKVDTSTDRTETKAKPATKRRSKTSAATKKAVASLRASQTKTSPVDETSAAADKSSDKATKAAKKTSTRKATSKTRSATKKAVASLKAKTLGEDTNTTASTPVESGEDTKPKETQTKTSKAPRKTAKTTSTGRSRAKTAASKKPSAAASKAGEANSSDGATSSEGKTSGRTTKAPAKKAPSRRKGATSAQSKAADATTKDGAPTTSTGTDESTAAATTSTKTVRGRRKAAADKAPAKATTRKSRAATKTAPATDDTATATTAEKETTAPKKTARTTRKKTASAPAKTAVKTTKSSTRAKSATSKTKAPADADTTAKTKRRTKKVTKADDDGTPVRDPAVKPKTARTRTASKSSSRSTAKSASKPKAPAKTASRASKSAKAKPKDGDA
ncbi:MAG: Rne/Rng family ribonuclease [Myxococcota bacterium]|nr:Rne/Rng family ribonuclease [Myxococcota bacterium]